MRELNSHELRLIRYSLIKNINSLKDEYINMAMTDKDDDDSIWNEIQEKEKLLAKVENAIKELEDEEYE